MRNCYDCFAIKKTALGFKICDNSICWLTFIMFFSSMLRFFEINNFASLLFYQLNDWKLSEDLLELIEYDISNSKDNGDSLFVKAVAMRIFGRYVLASSSITGQPPKWAPEAQPRPRLNETKMEYIRCE